jgi:hypothetical protein
MSAIATRTTQANPDLRRAGAAFAALALAGGLLGAVVLVRQGADTAIASPAGVPAAVQHDRGWSTAGQGPARLIVVSGSGAIEYTGIPYPAPGTVRSGSDGTSGTLFHR